MIYGANGYTGALVARLAVSRGQRPVLAGRNAAAVGALADELGLDRVVFDLADRAAVHAALRNVRVVAHCAGPFAATFAPMIDACLATGTHYLDVTGELPVLRSVLDRDREARNCGVALLTGAGFDVVPTDCLAGLLVAALPDAVSLELAIRVPGGMSRGTATTALSIAAGGGLRRVDGRLQPTPFGSPERVVPFPSRPRRVSAVPWGDLVTAHHWSGIGDITVYTALPIRGPIRRALATVGQRLLRYDPVRAVVAAMVRRRPPGPTAETRAATSVEVWGEVRNAAGSIRSATITGPNAYDLTADAVVRAAARLAEPDAVPPGAHTPVTALGPDFVRELDKVTVSEIRDG